MEASRSTPRSSERPGATGQELPVWECLDLLESATVGRVCVIEQGYPVAFPLNYRVTRAAEGQTIVLRTAPHTAVARYEGPACLEVDHVDPAEGTAWSVIVRGSLRRVAGAHDLVDPRPLVTEGRSTWTVLSVAAISGRRFVSRPDAAGFSVEWQAVDG